MKSKIITIGKLLETQNLTIPTYQRPYKWTAKNVNQLIDDIIAHQDKTAYRLGTLVIHKEEKNGVTKNNIVDGQQRSITLNLIAYAISKNCREKYIDTHEDLFSGLDKNSLLNCQIQNDITIENIKNNYNLIRRRVSSFDINTILFFAEKCELIQIDLSDINEAFQFFDSQNSRGRDLEPHDLLKAFHLREMQNHTEEEKIKIVTAWETLESNKLSTLFENHLFRIRSWSKGRSARYFTKNDIDIFKGVNLENTQLYPYLKVYRIGDHMTASLSSSETEDTVNTPAPAQFPFQIDQIIINGKLFFEMIAHSLKLFEELESIRSNTLASSNNAPKAKILTTLRNYEGSKRTGDLYIKTLFDCALLYYLDKFGACHLDKVIEKVFIWAYSLRMQLQAVHIASIDNYALETDFFNFIREALHPVNVVNFPTISIEKNNSTKTDEIFQLFKDLNYA